MLGLASTWNDQSKENTFTCRTLPIELSVHKFFYYGRDVCMYAYVYLENNKDYARMFLQQRSA